jgi:hypothetical protein
MDSLKILDHSKVHIERYEKGMSELKTLCRLWSMSFPHVRERVEREVADAPAQYRIVIEWAKSEIQNRRGVAVPLMTEGERLANEL